MTPAEQLAILKYGEAKLRTAGRLVNFIAILTILGWRIDRVSDRVLFPNLRILGRSRPSTSVRTIPVSRLSMASREERTGKSAQLPIDLLSIFNAFLSVTEWQ
jgi:hypothetical protein